MFSKCKFWWDPLFTKKTVRDVDLAGKQILLGSDYNVPLEKGVIADDYRIKQSLPTIQYILDQHPRKLIIMSHLGRPKGVVDPALSLSPVAKRLGELLNREVRFAPDCIGDATKNMVNELPEGGIILLENLRFHPEEEKNDDGFARQLAETSGAEIFVENAFGNAHRSHASTVAIAKIVMGVAGLLVEKEVDIITNAMQQPTHPLVAVVGGAKISDKIEVLNNFIEKADAVAVVGALGNNFLLAEGLKLGQSMVEPDVLDTTKEILQKARDAEKSRNFCFFVPVDGVVSVSKDGTQPTRVVDFASHTLADIQAYPKKPEPASYEIGENEILLDIGPISAARIAGAIELSNTVIWGGPCGVTEVKGIAGASDPFAHGTSVIVDSMIGSSNNHQNKPFSVVGGGDTADYIQSEGILEDFNHVSTGGSASLDLMAGKTLPAVDVLWDK
jgi:phosphoglycerate kinase